MKKKFQQNITCSNQKCFQFFIGGFMVKSWTTNFATIYLVINNVLDIQMESATPIWIFTFENLSNNIKWALEFGQCLVPHILLFNFKTSRDYITLKMKIHLQMLGLTLLHFLALVGLYGWVPIHPLNLLPLSCFNLAHEPNANVATMTKGMKIQISLCTCYNCDLQ